MTLGEYIRSECANCNSDMSCKGIGIHDNLLVFGFGPKEKCVVMDSERCKYLEECVLPAVESACEDNAAKWLDARNHYYKVTKQENPATKLCNRCKKPMQKGRSLCPSCLKDRRKSARNR